MDQQRIIKLRTMPYEQYLQTPEWAVKRDQALERDGHRCRACNSEEKLNVHHRTYARRGNEDLNDLTTLCQPCHEHFHKRIDQERMMQQTYESPFDRDAWLKENQHHKEYYLIGLLINNPDLVSHVTVILSEKDFPTSDLCALFQVLATPSDQPFEKRVPDALKPAALKALHVLDEDTPFEMDDEARVKSAMQSASRIKRDRLKEEHIRLLGLIEEVAKSGDKDALREIRMKSVAIQQQILIINTALNPKKYDVSSKRKRTLG